MKVESGIRGFNPITLTLTLESPREAQDFYNLFNHARILGCCPSIDDGAVREAIGDEYGNTFDDFGQSLAVAFGVKEED
jgi:hypothetical protein